VKIPPPAPTSNLSEILAFGFWMRKQGYRPSTIRSTIDTLKAVARKTNLLDPEAVKTHLASASVSVGRKEKVCQDLARFYKFKQMLCPVYSKTFLAKSGLKLRSSELN
jgi:hypothetical protein